MHSPCCYDEQGYCAFEAVLIDEEPKMSAEWCNNVGEDIVHELLHQVYLEAYLAQPHQWSQGKNFSHQSLIAIESEACDYKE